MTKLLLAAVAVAIACAALIPYLQRKRWERFFAARGFTPVDVNQIAARVGGAMAALFAPGKGLFTRNSFGGRIGEREAWFTSFAATSGAMRAAMFVAADAGTSGLLGPNLSVMSIGPWVVFLSERPVTLKDLDAWLATVSEESRKL